MTSDNPMDISPADYGSDRYDMVEVVNAPVGVIPFGLWLDRLMEQACPDCRANVIIRYAEPAPDWPLSQGWVDRNGHTWFVGIAHDDACPTLKMFEERSDPEN